MKELWLEPPREQTCSEHGPLLLLVGTDEGAFFPDGRNLWACANPGLSKTGLPEFKIPRVILVYFDDCACTAPIAGETTQNSTITKFMHTLYFIVPAHDNNVCKHHRHKFKIQHRPYG